MSHSASRPAEPRRDIYGLIRERSEIRQGTQIGRFKRDAVSQEEVLEPGLSLEWPVTRTEFGAHGTKIVQQDMRPKEPL